MNSKQYLFIFFRRLIEIFIISSMVLYVLAISNSQQSPLFLNIANLVTNYFLFGFCALSLFVYKIRPSEVFMYFGIFVISCIIYEHSNDPNIIKLILLIIIMRRFNIRKILYIFLISNVSILFITLFMFGIGQWADTIMIENSTIKHSFGFIQPNSLGRTVFLIILILLTGSAMGEFQKIFKRKIWVGVLTLLLVYLLYMSKSTASILGSFLSLVFFVLVCLYKNKSVLFKKIIKLSSLSLFFGSLSFTFYFAINNSYNSVIGQTLNNILTGRLYFSYQYFSNYDLTMFGQKLFVNTDTSIGAVYQYLDNGILVVVLSYGIIFAILLLIYYLALIERCFSRNLIPLLVPIVVLLVFSVVEKSGLTFYTNFSLYFITLLFNENKILRGTILSPGQIYDKSTFKIS